MDGEAGGRRYDDNCWWGEVGRERGGQGEGDRVLRMGWGWGGASGVFFGMI